MPNNSQPDNFKLPPELSAIENRLRDLPSPHGASIDRDDLMFQSGWAAAMAEKNSSATSSRSAASHWGWPVLSGTFATIAAALAITLWVSPNRGDDLPMARAPDAAATQLVIEANQNEVHGQRLKESPEADAASSLAISNPIQRALGPYFESMIIKNPASLRLAARNHLLRGIDFEEMERPIVRNVSTRPQREPLKASSYRNQELWEQL